MNAVRWHSLRCACCEEPATIRRRMTQRTTSASATALTFTCDVLSNYINWLLVDRIVRIIRNNHRPHRKSLTWGCVIFRMRARSSRKQHACSHMVPRMRRGVVVRVFSRVRVTCYTHMRSDISRAAARVAVTETRRTYDATHGHDARTRDARESMTAAVLQRL